MVLTETWLTGNERDSHSLAILKETLPHLDFHHIPRYSGRGGGVGVLLHKGYHVSRNPLEYFKSFEYLDLNVSSSKFCSFRLIALYRPPASKKNKTPLGTFFKEFSSLLEILLSSPQRLIIAGDFNIHIEKSNRAEVLNFLDILRMSKLRNHITCSTHMAGHTLDLVISRDDDSLVSSVKSTQSLPSDHSAIICRLNTLKPNPVKRHITARNLKDIEMDKFCLDITSSNLYSDGTPVSNPEQLMELYDKELRRILDDHAPTKENDVILRPHAPWYTKSLRRAKQERRRKERRADKTKLTVDKESYLDSCKSYNEQLLQAKSSYFLEKVRASDSRALFRLTNSLSIPTQLMVLPEHDSDLQLATSFGDFFETKIKKLRDELNCCPNQDMSVQVPDTCDASLAEFDDVTEDEVLKTIKAACNSTCNLDPIPTSLLKKCTPTLLPILTDVVNSSLQAGVVPETMKQAIVSPRIKKDNLPRNELKSYRPISNLSFAAKLVERTVACQVNDYLATNNLLPDVQSAYRAHHSV
ncbi:uncharacterized protein LOC135155265 [Lytechinus pictus]|uniref:uncharacterized protein LOC135155265 n=1 Tax=Lytechinus pictus TaxID=7653 RepID=UPI0030BA27E2